MNEAPPNKLFDAGYRQRYPRGTAAQEAYEQACDRGASKEALAALNTAYSAACTADEQEHTPLPPAIRSKCACGSWFNPASAPERCPDCNRRLSDVVRR